MHRLFVAVNILYAHTERALALLYILYIRVRFTYARARKSVTASRCAAHFDSIELQAISHFPIALKSTLA
jgi:hypothetical protein